MDASDFVPRRPELAEGESLEPAESLRPLVMSESTRFAILAGMGAIGGAFVAKLAMEHFFSKGLTTEERKNILSFGAVSALLVASKVFFDLDEETVTGSKLIEQGIASAKGEFKGK